MARKKPRRKPRNKRRSERRRRKPRLAFGIELEFVNRTRLEVARALNYEFGGYLQVWSDDEYDEEIVREEFSQDKEEFLLFFMDRGRKVRWQIVEDESLNAEPGELRRGEVVIGPLEERDLHLIPRICKTLLIAGCKINDSCGVHVHFSSNPFDGRSLRRMIALTYMYEPILYRVLQVPAERRDKYAKAIHEGFAREVLAATDEPLTIMHKWYELCGSGVSTGRFDTVRYYGLNLNAQPLENHYELRYFNGTLDPDVVLSYAHLALGVLRYSLRTRPSPTLTQAMETREEVLALPGAHARTFGKLLKVMGLGSRRFARTRDLFLKNL